MKIFSDKNYLPGGKGHVVLLYPFWGEYPDDPRHPASGQFSRYLEVGKSLFKMTSLEDADFAVLPFDWTHTIHNKKIRDIAIQFAKKVQKAGKKTIIFFSNDSEKEVPIENAIIFRTSFYRSSRKTNEYAMPSWSEDFIKYTGGLPRIQIKKIKPLIGFCGSADAHEEMSLKYKLKAILLRTIQLSFDYKKLSNPGTIIRANALSVLSNSPLVETNFIIKNTFFGGACKPLRSVDFVLMHKARLEYVRNMVESDYTLCCRGNGNFSYRLYETLNCGRIPLFIDTDCVLPYDFLIDYSHYFVWVDLKEVSQIAEKVNEFHKGISVAEFVTRQQSCRKLWEDYLSPEGFFTNFHKHFDMVGKGSALEKTR